MQVPGNDLGCKIGPGDEKISFGSLEESADAWTEGCGMEPLNEVSLSFVGKQGIRLWLVGREG